MSKDVPKVFISYAREDSSTAQRLYYDLKRIGVKPWLDIVDLLPGQQWKIAIRRAIKESTYFIALLSSNAVSKRGFVQSELKQALEVLNEYPEDEIFVIPVRIEQCTPSHERLEDLNWVDLFPSYDEGLRRIKTVLLGTTQDDEQPQLSLLEVYDTKWIGGGAFAETKNGRYPLATILKNPRPRDISSFYGTACAVRFQAEAPAGIPWAAIDEIAIIVNSYHPLPEYEPIYPLPFQDAHVYFVEIDNPEHTQSRKFLAEYIFHEDHQERLGLVRLEVGKPEVFVVRVNAKTPGIYNFDLIVTASYKDSKQDIRVISAKNFLFEGY